jgi:hypothetical protein
MLKPSTRVPFSAAVLPEPIIANSGIFLPGQNGGFLGSRWAPEYFRCDPAAPEFKIEGFALPPELSPARLDGRRGLAQQFDQHMHWIARTGAAQQQDRTIRDALGIVGSSKARAAFRLEREPATVRDRYGHTKWGQSLLLGIGHHAIFRDKSDRPHKVTQGEPIRAVIGLGPANGWR